MNIPDEKREQAIKLMDYLGNQNQSIHGLSGREEGIFDTLLWLIGDGEAPDELEDAEY